MPPDEDDEVAGLLDVADLIAPVDEVTQVIVTESEPVVVVETGVESVEVTTDVERVIVAPDDRVRVTDPVREVVVVREGIRGPQGLQGEQGEQGEPGEPGPPGTGDDKHFEFVQASASALWVINHGLDKHPAVVTVDSAGQAKYGAISYPSLNVVEVLFAAPFAGIAYLN